MLPLWALALVSLICDSSTLCVAAQEAAAGSKVNYRKSCVGIDDIHEAVCCENELSSGAGLACCGGQAFSPEEATCCEVEDGNNKTAVTWGLSEKVSECCGLKAYNQLNELCCESVVIAKSAPNAHCCAKEAFNEETELCCGPITNKVILQRKSRDHLCCGHNQFNNKTECCCPENLHIEPITSNCCQGQSVQSRENAVNSFNKLCDEQAFNEETELCCGPMDNKVILQRKSRDHLCCGHNQFNNKTECCCPENLHIEPITSNCCQGQSVQSGPNASSSSNKLCGEQAFNEETELCCGPITNKVILQRMSRDHLCCGHNQFNNKTECCCPENLHIEPITSSCCQGQSGVQQQKPANQPTCTETSLCDPSCYNLRNRGKFKRCAPGRCADVLTLYNPHTHVSCDGCVSTWKPDQFHGSHGLHRCGTGVYQPHSEICCDGHRHLKGENTHCCGTRAYSIKDKGVKCCARTLHKLTTAHEAQCCGSRLLTPPNVCCSSEDMEVLYSAKTGFGCCGHHYFNTSLWLCCAGNLSPVKKPGHQSERIKESNLLSVHNLNEAALCEEMHIGTVESVSLHSIVFTHVLKINGRKATVTPLPLPHILKIPDFCISPKLIPGKDYFFDKVHVFTDFDHDSSLQSLNLIFSKCSRHVTTTT